MKGKILLFKLSGVFASAIIAGTSFCGFTVVEAASQTENAQPDVMMQDASSRKYDPRPDGVSKVREQYWGVCWAMAGISSTESFLIREGLESNGVQLSVEDVLWRTQGGWVMPRRDVGGYSATITGYLQTEGVRSETDIPYFGEPSDGDYEGSLYYGEGENLKPAGFDTAPVIYEITDIAFTRDNSPELIKDMIVRYGAVSANYHDSEEGFNEETGAYWDKKEEYGESNHAVSIVGWDEDYPKENFKPINGELPKDNGAWIIKNSYGADYGPDGGYTYISYEDEYIMGAYDENAYLYSVAGARKPLKQKRYMWDQYGAVSSWKTEPGSSTWANVFDFGADERINELSFVTWSKGCDYQLHYLSMEGNVPSADTSNRILLSEGKIEHDGYMTVTSQWDKNVPEGKGAIVLTVIGNNPSIGTDEPILQYGRPFFNPIQDKGSGFFLKGGVFTEAEVPRSTGVFDYIEQPDLCIRAYTVHSEKEEEKLTQPTNPTDPVEPDKPTNPTDPAEPDKSTDSTDKTVVDKSTIHADPAAPGKQGDNIKAGDIKDDAQKESVKAADASGTAQVKKEAYVARYSSNTEPNVTAADTGDSRKAYTWIAVAVSCVAAIAVTGLAVKLKKR